MSFLLEEVVFSRVAIGTMSEVRTIQTTFYPALLTKPKRIHKVIVSLVAF